MHKFQINGRFLNQKMTGVQRYAYEITKSIGTIIENSKDEFQVVIMTPSQVASNTIPSSMRHEVIGPFTGHLWEQSSLPGHSQGLLLNLCNSGPLIKRNQITCIHGANSFIFPGSYSKKFYLSQKILLNAMGRLSVRLTTVSKASAELLYKLNIVPDTKPIAIIPNGHEHALRWCSKRSIFNETFSFTRPFVLLIGSQSPHKNVKLITSLSSHLDKIGIDILISGGKFGIFSNNDNSEKTKNVFFLDYVSDDDLAFLLSKALCLAFPSLIEGFGLPLVEAMVHNCPIIASNTTSIPEVCGSAAVLVPPDRPDLWLEAISSLKNNEDLQKNLIAKGKIQMKKFSWEASGRDYLKLISSI